MCLLPSASRRQLGVIHKDAAINLEQYQDQKLNDDFDDISGWLEINGGKANTFLLVFRF